MGRAQPVFQLPVSERQVQLMFDSVRSKPKAPQGNIAGLGLSLLIASSVTGAVLYWPLMKRAKREREVEVTLVAARATATAAEPTTAPAPAPPPPSASAPKRSVEKKVDRKPLIVEKKPESEPDLQTDSAPAPTDAAPSNSSGGEPGGVVGGVQGGVVGGVVGGVSSGVGRAGGGIGVIPFGVGMSRPTQIAGATPAYSREAIAARVEGKVLVRCVITAQGAIQDCKVIKGLPFLEAITLDALRTSRFMPVMFQGRAMAVQYLFTFNFKLP
jgi:protein TonB